MIAPSSRDDQLEGPLDRNTVPTLVFGDDGSTAADVAWLWILNQRWPGWRLEVVSACPPEIGPPLPEERTELHRWEPSKPRSVFAETGFVEMDQLMAEADPRLVLSRPSDLLVIGPRGSGFLKSLHIGSTADWLLARPPAPLVIVRSGHAMESVLLCVDGSMHAQRVTDVLAELPGVDRLAVTVLAVDDRRCGAEAASSAAVERLESAGATVASSVVAGEPVEVIMGHVERLAPDLVALGTRGLTGLRRLRVGSTAGAVVRAAGCSTLVACAGQHLVD